MRLDQQVFDLAMTQHGAVATWQLEGLGASKQEIWRLKQSNGWQPLSARVIARAGSPSTTHQRLVAAVLDLSPGAAIAGTTAAWLWGAPGFDPEPIHVVRHRGLSRRPSALATVHEVVDLHPNHLKVIEGITVISPSRVVCELAGSHPHRAERILDRFWSDRLLDGRIFRRTVDEFTDRGRTGSAYLHELDAARGPSYVPPASGLESRFQEIVDWPMRRQIDSGGEEWCGRVDFRDAVLPLIVEVQSERFHTSLVDQAADAARKARLEAAGFEVVEVWDSEVWHRPDVVNERIRQARWQAQRHAA